MAWQAGQAHASPPAVGDGGNGGDVDTGGGARRRRAGSSAAPSSTPPAVPASARICALLAHCSGHSRGIDQEHGGAQVLGDYIGAPGDNMVDDQADSAVGGFKSIVGRPADQEHPTAVVLEHPDRGAQAVSSVDEHVGPEPRHEAEVVPAMAIMCPARRAARTRTCQPGTTSSRTAKSATRPPLHMRPWVATGRAGGEAAAGRSWDRKIAQ